MQINNQKNAESLAAVIIAVFILSIALTWIINVVSFSKETSLSYESKIFEHILQSNSDNIINKIDRSDVWEEEYFYIHKDSNNKEFEIFTGALNEEYQYIDRLGNKIENTNENIWNIYKRIFTNTDDIFKHIILPSEIKWLALHYDAQNINGNLNIWLVDDDQIGNWNDLANWYDATQWNNSQKPIYKINGINGNAYLEFDGLSHFLDIGDNAESNTDNLVNIIEYQEKSFAIVLETGWDVSSPQTIYEQWWNDRWYSIVVHNWSIYAGIWNNIDWDIPHQYKSVNLWEAISDSVYYITIVQDSSHIIDDHNKLQIYLNWILVHKQTHVDPQQEQSDDIWLWWVHDNSVRASDNFIISNSGHSDLFNWGLWEFISWNHALSQTEVTWLHNYFLERWVGWQQNIEYSIMNTDIDKYISN